MISYFFRPLILADLLLMKRLLKPLHKSVFVPLILTGARQQQMQVFKRKFLDLVWQH